MAERLQLGFVVDEHRVAEAASELHRQLRPHQWRILAALAAEIVSVHEAAQTGSRVVLASAAEAERVLQDLARGR